MHYIIHGTYHACCQRIVSFLEGCPLSRWSFKREEPLYYIQCDAVYGGTTFMTLYSGNLFYFLTTLNLVRVHENT